VSKIYVAGHRGLVGSAIVRQIELQRVHEWCGESRAQVDLLDSQQVQQYIRQEKPEIVVIAAARVGGISANSAYPVEFLSENLRIMVNILDACHESDVSRLLYLGSSCIYPRLAPQPIKEEYLLTGELEPTNEAYAIAKIAGVKLIQAYRRQYGRSWIAAMPTNLYGPGDNFDLESSHVLPALLRRFHEAKVSGSNSMSAWGTGSPRREFLHVDDLAQACLFLLENYDDEIPINIGCGTDVTIKELTELVAGVVGFTGNIEWDSSKPDGTPRKLLDTSRINNLGWRPTIQLSDGITETYRWFLDNLPS
jgi:GDP-L-fucose synthase